MYVEQVCQVDVVVFDYMYQCFLVDLLQVLVQGFEGGGVDQVGFVYQDVVGEVDLGLGDGFLQVMFGVGSVYQGDDVVQYVVLVEFFVGEEGLCYWCWIGQVGVFDYQVVEVDFVVVVVFQQEEQGFFQVGVD